MITGVSPVLLVADLDRTVEWWRDRLGFEVTVPEADFATASRDGHTVFLVRADEGVAYRRLVPGMWNVYFRVDDVEALHAEVQERGVTIEHSLCDRPYGMREFAVRDTDGHDIGFGQPLRPA